MRACGLLSIGVVLFRTVSSLSIRQSSNLTDTESLDWLQDLINSTAYNETVIGDQVTGIKPVDPAVAWSKSVQKGAALWYALQSGCFPDKRDPPSIWELIRSGWVIDPWPPKAKKLKDTHNRPYPPALRAMHATTGADYYQVDVTYDAWEKTGKPSASFLGLYSLKSQFIVAQASNSHEMVNVHWSDAIFAAWQGIKTSASWPGADLQYVLRSFVANANTESVLNQIKGSIKGVRYPLKAIIEPHLQTEWFYALLGSPNGAGVAYLLLDHKKALGRKMVDGITIFCPQEHLLCHILFEIGDLSTYSRRDTCNNTAIEQIANQTGSGEFQSAVVVRNTTQGIRPPPQQTQLVAVS